jgi:kynurenine formamidase
VKRNKLSLAALALAAMACGPRQEPPPRPPIDLSRTRLVDLTHPFDEATLYWPTAPSGFEHRRLSWGVTPGGFFYSAYSLCAPEHGGTHLDAPIHFAEAGRGVDRIPLDQLVAPAAVLDVSAAAAADPDYRLTLSDLEVWEARHGRVPEGAAVLLRTGWSARWPDRRAYLGDDAPGEVAALHFPSYAEQAAARLVSERRVAARGGDTASIDYGQSADFPVHRLAAAAQVPGYENLARLEELPPTGAWVVALPMKIAGGSGAPLRIVAFVPAR